MITYHKIENVFNRNPDTHLLIEGDWKTSEFAYLANNEWVWTEKVDGTNIRVMWDGTSMEVRGKTDRADLHKDLLGQIYLLVNNERLEDVFGVEGNICLYGEGYGAGIQRGGNYSPNKDFVLFDIKIGDWWLQREDVEDIASQLMLDIVPIVGRGTLLEAVELVKLGFNSQWGDFIAEGLVCRPATELKTRAGGRVITKIKYRDFPH